YGKRRRYLTGRQHDSVMQYPVRQAIIDFVCERGDGAQLCSRITSLLENYPPPALYGGLSFLSGHDIPRILTVLGDAPTHLGRDGEAAFRLSPAMRTLAKERLRVALALLVTLPGVPCIFYGDEAGMEGFGDPFCRSTYPWGQVDDDVHTMYRELLHLRREYPDLCEGTLSFLQATGRCIVFRRGTLTVYINGGREAATVSPEGILVEIPPMGYTIRSQKKV
ncbi:MAG: DUF3459 domain-containing protein, partial [Ruminococcaceae bacterium]|nr:DUF3459 domain-containing protein [Oscillospiraceae bacterium]